MVKRLFLIALLILPFALSQSVLAEQEATTVSQTVKTRLDKQETTNLMLQVGRMSAKEQDARLAGILKDQADSKTPRSDFLFCSGLAYLGNYKAQMCAGYAYEKGLGIVEDLSQAYAWYALALESHITDDADAKKLEADRDRVKNRLLSTYPHPTEDDLEALVDSQKSQIARYQEQIAKDK
jgi:hypothetical protein